MRHRAVMRDVFCVECCEIASLVLLYPMAYVPLECGQRRCREHARHRVATRGKRQFRCDRHAGVCIVA